MDSLQSNVSGGAFDADPTARHLAVVPSPAPSRPMVEPLIPNSLTLQRFDDLDAVVVTKATPGFTAEAIERLRVLIRDAAAGRLGQLKFIVFDFAHEGEADRAPSEEFQALVGEAANLILQAPVVLVASARGAMAGADLDFALACSMLIGEAGATFSFGADPVISMDTYGFLAQKLGFVRAERLMESADLLSAEQMHGLLLLKHISEPGSGLDGVRQFLTRTARRYNSCYGIYRAHRMAAPAVREGLLRA
jgi:enoyl-CoA hydratase/carnithine racemase